MPAAKKKVFFHHEAKGFETYTKGIYLRENESSVAEIIQKFTKSFQLDHPEKDLGHVQVTDASGNLFDSSDDLFSLLKNKDDCYVVSKKKKAETATADSKELRPRQPAPPPAAVTSASTARDKESHEKMDSAAASSGRKVDYDQLMRSVDDLMAQKALRKARDVCLDILSDNNYRNDTRSLEMLCQIAFKSEKYEEVVLRGEQALTGFSDAHGDLKRSADNTALLLSCLQILLLVGRSQSMLGETEEALERALQGLHLLRSCCSQGTFSCSSLRDAISTSALTSPRSVQTIALETPIIVAVHVAATPPRQAAQQKQLISLELDFKADLTSCLFQLGRDEEAGAVVNALIGHPSSATHVLSLLVYAEIAAAYNKIPEAVQGALKAIVLDSTHMRCKKLVCKLLSSEAGLQEVYKQVPPVAQAAAAYSFLAGVAKDLSLLDTADTLLRQVLKLDPKKDATHFLGLVHVLEGKLDYKGALNTIILAISSQQRRAEYDESHQGGSFFPGTSVCGWSREWNELLTRAVGDMPGGVSGRGGGGSSKSGKPAAGAACPPANTVHTDALGLHVLFFKKDVGASKPAAMSGGKASSGSQQVDGDFALVLPLPGAPNSPSAPDVEELMRGPSKAAEEFDSNLLDILALAFTAIKLLFLQGRLGALLPLIRHVEWARRASKRPLHETNIRNEHAYYLCIVQIMAHYTSPALGSEAEAQFSPFANKDVLESWSNSSCRGQTISAIYVCGDSHVLSSAFSVLSLSPSSRRVLIPKLVTGVKQWHLRKESQFYTKEIFKRTMATVPNGSEVILIVGEIDCREGILVAVERGVYKDVREGMSATIAVFKQVVQDLIQKKRLKVHIHPVVPVLDVTRQIVLMFNSLYKAAMEGVQDCHWLDIEDKFVVSSSGGSTPGAGGLVLREELKLDGTHLHPRYVSLLQATLGGEGDKSS